jgi:hypothetical protein
MSYLELGRFLNEFIDKSMAFIYNECVNSKTNEN